MKIALVIPALPGYSETFLTNKIAGLKTSGFEVVLLVVGVSEKREMGVPVYYQPILAASGLMRWIYTFWLIKKSLFIAPKRVFKLLDETKKIGYNTWGQWRMVAVLSNFLPLKNVDWIHFSYATMAVERAFIGKVLNAKVALSLRGYDIAIAPLLRPDMYKNVWPYLDKVHSISNDLIVEAKNQGIPENLSVEIIHPAVVAEKFDTGIRNFSDGKLRILTVGRLHWKKGLEYTLHALALLDINFEYTIIGAGEERERLIFAAHQLGILDKVNFVGKKNHDQVVLAMRENDMYLQYSIQEGFCNAVLEAQAAGMLCVVSDAEGLPENVVHQKTGWVVPKRNPEALTQTIASIYHRTANEKIKISEATKNRVKLNFGLNAQHKKFAAFYHND